MYGLALRAALLAAGFLSTSLSAAAPAEEAKEFAGASRGVDFCLPLLVWVASTGCRPRVLAWALSGPAEVLLLPVVVVVLLLALCLAAASGAVTVTAEALLLLLLVLPLAAASGAVAVTAEAPLLPLLARAL